MSFGDDDLDIFVADFGDPYVAGGVVARGIFDESDQLVGTAEGQVEALVRAITLTVKRTDWPSLVDGATVAGPVTAAGATIPGTTRTFVVRGDPELLDEGAFKRIHLAEVTP